MATNQSKACPINWDATKRSSRKHPQWILKLPILPTEIMETIATWSSPITAIKLRSTCSTLYTKLESFYDDFCRKLSCDCYMDDCLAYTTVTHFVTNIPENVCSDLKIYLKQSYAEKIPGLEISKLPTHEGASGYRCYELPPTKCRAICIGTSPTDYCLPELVTDSEKAWGRPEIIDTLWFKPIHCSHASGWVIPRHLRKDDTNTYKVIICTGPLVF